MQCTDFVKEFAPAIIELVDKEINPEEICKVMTYFCSTPLGLTFMRDSRDGIHCVHVQLLDPPPSRREEEESLACQITSQNLS